MRVTLPIALLVMFFSAQAMAVDKPKGAVAPGSCVTADCHPKIKDFKVLHGPVNVNACEACHKATNVEEHRFELAREKKDLCTFCHKIDTGTDIVIHKPVVQNECLSCHNPHGGTTVKTLRTANMADLCKKCHVDVVQKKTHVHGPVAAGACSSCHKPHSSANPKLLVATGKDLCFTCHTEMKNQMATVKVKHKAVEQDCMSCHDAHASNFVMQTKMAPAQLCTSCHEHDKIKSAAMDAKYKHSIVTTDQACLNCHTAHGGDLSKLMKAEPVKVCMKCHKDPIEASDGRKVAAVAEVLDPKMVKHGPIQQGNCAGCHNVHGSNVQKLLLKQYPATFYAPFKMDDYALCFTCHNKQLVTLEKTESLTNFRDGDRSLHFVHVNKAERGRTCRACHEAHASPNPLEIRTAVPYGNWQMPLNFKKTETGGSCAPGCHKPFTYDRNNAANLPTTMPTSPPSAPSVAADPRNQQP